MTDDTDIDIDDAKDIIRDLLAMERDRELGYESSELHRNPIGAIEEAVEFLESLGDDPDELVLPDDQERLGLDFSDDTVPPGDQMTLGRDD